MKGKREDSPLTPGGLSPAASPDEANHLALDGEADAELRELLRQWPAPEAPPSLDERVAIAYRRIIKEGILSNHTVNESNSVLYPERHRRSEVVKMKQCPTCEEQFAEKFAFCPVDGTPLNGLHAPAVAPVAEPAPPVSVPSNGSSAVKTVPPAAAASVVSPPPAISSVPAGPHDEYHLTMIEDAGLVRRLTTELREVAHQSELTWPEFKKDPVGFSRRTVTAYGRLAWRSLSQPNVATGIATAFVVILSVVGFIAFYEYWKAKHPEAFAVNPNYDFVSMLDTNIPEEQQKPDKGNAGINGKGKGGGSKPQFEKPSGGGGGGREEPTPVSRGKIPTPSIEQPQVLAPNPKVPPIKNPALPTAVTLDLDPKLARLDPRNIPYGDPKASATELSSGPGRGNGMGNGTGMGMGSGEGPGYGPGRGGNMGGGERGLGGGGEGGNGGGIDYNKTFSQKEVTRRVQILSKPEPTFTEEARKNNVTGVVTLRLVLASSGAVTSITPLKRLPDGLTEKAIAAARQIKFIPAQKDGRNVSVYIVVEYNFNMY